MTAEITHTKLVKAAGAWLGKQARVVATELHTSRVSETPDAIGWGGRGYCIVVECKASRADFLANARKKHEQKGTGVGDERWFLAPNRVIMKEDVPEGWGLMEMVPSGHKSGYFFRVVVPAPKRTRKMQASVRAEFQMLISVAGRSLEACDRIRSVWLGEEHTIPENTCGPDTCVSCPMKLRGCPGIEPKYARNPQQ